MTWWIVRADYRPLSDKSPRYAFLSGGGATARQVERAFRARWNQLQNVAVRQVTEQEMEQDPIHVWVMWI